MMATSPEAVGPLGRGMWSQTATLCMSELLLAYHRLSLSSCRRLSREPPPTLAAAVALQASKTATRIRTSQTAVHAAGSMHLRKGLLRPLMLNGGRKNLGTYDWARFICEISMHVASNSSTGQHKPSILQAFSLITFL